MGPPTKRPRPGRSFTSDASGSARAPRMPSRPAAGPTRQRGHADAHSVASSASPRTCATPHGGDARTVGTAASTVSQDTTRQLRLSPSETDLLVSLHAMVRVPGAALQVPLSPQHEAGRDKRTAEQYRELVAKIQLAAARAADAASLAESAAALDDGGDAQLPPSPSTRDKAVLGIQTVPWQSYDEALAESLDDERDKLVSLMHDARGLRTSIWTELEYSLSAPAEHGTGSRRPAGATRLSTGPQDDTKALAALQMRVTYAAADAFLSPSAVAQVKARADAKVKTSPAKTAARTVVSVARSQHRTRRDQHNTAEALLSPFARTRDDFGGPAPEAFPVGNNAGPGSDGELSDDTPLLSPYNKARRARMERERVMAKPSMERLSVKLNALASKQRMQNRATSLKFPSLAARVRNADGTFADSVAAAAKRAKLDAAAAKKKAKEAAAAARPVCDRNAGGCEEPHSDNPEIFNIDGTEMDMNATYKLGGQLWYIQERAKEARNRGAPVNGIAVEFVPPDSSDSDDSDGDGNGNGSSSTSTHATDDMTGYHASPHPGATTVVSPASHTAAAATAALLLGDARHGVSGTPNSPGRSVLGMSAPGSPGRSVNFSEAPSQQSSPERRGGVSRRGAALAEAPLPRAPLHAPRRMTQAVRPGNRAVPGPPPRRPRGMTEAQAMKTILAQVAAKGFGRKTTRESFCAPTKASTRMSRPTARFTDGRHRRRETSLLPTPLVAQRTRTLFFASTPFALPGQGRGSSSGSPGPAAISEEGPPPRAAAPGPRRPAVVYEDGPARAIRTRQCRESRAQMKQHQLRRARRVLHRAQAARVIQRTWRERVLRLRLIAEIHSKVRQRMIDRMWRATTHRATRLALGTLESKWREDLIYENAAMRIQGIYRFHVMMKSAGIWRELWYSTRKQRSANAEQHARLTATAWYKAMQRRSEDQSIEIKLWHERNREIEEAVKAAKLPRIIEAPSSPLVARGDDEAAASRNAAAALLTSALADSAPLLDIDLLLAPEAAVDLLAPELEPGPAVDLMAVSGHLLAQQLVLGVLAPFEPLADDAVDYLAPEEPVMRPNSLSPGELGSIEALCAPPTDFLAPLPDQIAARIALEAKKDEEARQPERTKAAALKAVQDAEAKRKKAQNRRRSMHRQGSVLATVAAATDASGGATLKERAAIDAAGLGRGAAGRGGRARRASAAPQSIEEKMALTERLKRKSRLQASQRVSGLGLVPGGAK